VVERQALPPKHGGTVNAAIGVVSALASVAGPVAEALARDPEAQRIAARARGRLRLDRMTDRQRRRWYRRVEDACDDLADANDDTEQAAAVLRLLDLGVSEAMIRASITIAEIMP